ncbi:hypothetical protein BJ508DRAFT_132052 [Ascobolus immersus RN42]|uniref:Uncharacterized protein n=1 Tax=Ascobolus immersus RN42 TaxID=1160509 RepID=A0A3N4I7I5_ASCIM|nr:hypothetical protein BJ508DRAFT_132052 [Ascobolus immersus RN42]
MASISAPAPTSLVERMLDVGWFCRGHPSNVDQDLLFAALALSNIELQVTHNERQELTYPFCSRTIPTPSTPHHLPLLLKLRQSPLLAYPLISAPSQPSRTLKVSSPTHRRLPPPSPQRQSRQPGSSLSFPSS